MTDLNLLYSVFDKHSVDSVSYIKDGDTFIFLIKEMSNSISLERWEHLEQILKDILKVDISILSYEYAKNYIDTSKAKVIKK